MKTARFLISLAALASIAAFAAEPNFPGLKSIMSEADWQKARLDRLSEDDLRLINDAFAQFLRGPDPATGDRARNQAVEVRTASLETTVAPSEAPRRRTMWERFGLAVTEEKPVETVMMKARVMAWHNTNGLVLDNGQIWDGLDPIRDELVGREIGIKQGRLGSFLLIVDGEDVSVRLHRVR